MRHILQISGNAIQMESTRRFQTVEYLGRDEGVHWGSVPVSLYGTWVVQPGILCVRNLWLSRTMSKALFTRNVRVCVNLNVCVNFTILLMVMQTHTQIVGPSPILCVCVCLTIHSIQNFNVDTNADVTCKQSINIVWEATWWKGPQHFSPCCENECMASVVHVIISGDVFRQVRSQLGWSGLFRAIYTSGQTAQWPVHKRRYERTVVTSSWRDSVHSVWCPDCRTSSAF